MPTSDEQWRAKWLRFRMALHAIEEVLSVTNLNLHRRTVDQRRDHTDTHRVLFI